MINYKFKKWFKNGYRLSEFDDLTLINTLIDRGYTVSKCNHKLIIDKSRLLYVEAQLKEEIHYSHDLNLKDLVDFCKKVVAQKMVNILVEKNLIEFHIEDMITPKSKILTIRGGINLIKSKK